ncbi:hypothetical protein Taro_042282 [Colocasia esculenta]|uniref:Uncharacterized protein n=1 Tax=Colocasia esculenta TaxID=4460 RepID=A0A843WW19_COLES|nr:hypothetical protein [Colocasia esculenta]
MQTTTASQRQTKRDHQGCRVQNATPRPVAFTDSEPTGTSLAMTVIRSIGNDYGHLGSWCWTETARTGKACMKKS